MPEFYYQMLKKSGEKNAQQRFRVWVKIKHT
jgi:hypothetical protein